MSIAIRDVGPFVPGSHSRAELWTDGYMRVTRPGGATVALRPIDSIQVTPMIRHIAGSLVAKWAKLPGRTTDELALAGLFLEGAGR